MYNIKSETKDFLLKRYKKNLEKICIFAIFLIFYTLKIIVCQFKTIIKKLPPE